MISGCIGQVHRIRGTEGAGVTRSSAIPHFGQDPGFRLRTSGCMGQVKISDEFCNGRVPVESPEDAEGALAASAMAYRPGSFTNFARHPAEQKKKGLPFHVSR